MKYTYRDENNNYYEVEQSFGADALDVLEFDGKIIEVTRVIVYNKKAIYKTTGFYTTDNGSMKAQINEMKKTAS